MNLRVWRIINPPAKPYLYSVESPEKAKEVIDELANKDLKNEEIFANAFGLEVKDKMGEWSEWYCEECGGDIDEHSEECQ